MRGVKIGVIAEEHDDIDVLYELACKIISENKFGFNRFVGHGCGTLKRKCNAWSRNLIKRGCSHIIVIHDLDNNDESKVRGQLEESIKDIDFAGRLILIPIYEIEAWLLSDTFALKQTFNMKNTPKVNKHPETIRNPKEYLRDIVWKHCKKHYINTIHNKRIAKTIRIGKLSVCNSFSPYPQFLKAL
jgi:hypothetical protein